MPRDDDSRDGAANRLYWESDASVAEIARRLGVSRRALYDAVRPEAAGLPCPDCGTGLIYRTRTARMLGEAECSRCGLEHDVEAVRESAREADGGGVGDGAAEVEEADAGGAVADSASASDPAGGAAGADGSGAGAGGSLAGAADREYPPIEEPGDASIDESAGFDPDELADMVVEGALDSGIADPVEPPESAVADAPEPADGERSEGMAGELSEPADGEPPESMAEAPPESAAEATAGDEAAESSRRPSAADFAGGAADDSTGASAEPPSDAVFDPTRYREQDGGTAEAGEFAAARHRRPAGATDGGDPALDARVAMLGMAALTGAVVGAIAIWLGSRR
ncbi:MAG: hypothetical protein ACOC8B_07620 [Gemmatimonadota bacterium]